MMELFFTLVKPYYKNVLNFVNNETFFLKFKIMQWNGVITKDE